ncbi:site-specific integrase [Acinetobacter soli]
MKLNECFTYYLKYSEHTSKETTVRHQNHLDVFFQDPEVTNVTRQSIRDYVHFRRVFQIDNATINRELHSARAAINFYLKDHDIDMKNPFSNFKLQENDPRIRFLTHQEAYILIKACSDNYYLHLFVRLALLTGCRTGELLKLTWDRVKFDTRYILLTKDHTKTKRRRFVALCDDAIKILHEHYQNRESDEYVFYNKRYNTHIKSLKKGFRYAREKAGIEDFVCHDLRHTFASWLVQSGVALYTVRDLLGHSCITTTERYAHLQNDHLRNALKSLPAI